jgi:hypothetical protein
VKGEKYDGKIEKENKAEWLFACSRIKHTPLHWLCYWNDWKSISYLLNLIDDDNEPLENIQMIMMDSYNDMSPLSMAGKHACDESAIMILEFFDKRFHYIERVFGVKRKDQNEDTVHDESLL